MISFIDFSNFFCTGTSAFFGLLLKLAGKYDKYFLANAIASSSVLVRTSPHPDTEQCIFAPPISSNETFSPMTISAIRGDPKYIEAFPSTITTMSQKAGIYAPPAAEGPNNKQVCGIRPDILI